jgi:tripartite ATP-independent transporter DctP family solute receptor
MKKKIEALSAALVLLVTLIGCSGSGSSSSAASPAPAAASGSKDIRFGHGNTVEQSIHIHALMWAEKIKEATNGRITATVYPAGQLGSLVEMLEAVEFGTLDMCAADAGLIGNSIPGYGLFGMPMLFTGYEQAKELYDGEIGQALAEQELKELNIKQLGWWWNGFRIFATNKPITTVADGKGLKIRSPETQVYIDTFKLLGMNPTIIPWGDTYTAYSTKLVDGMESTLEAICTQEFDKIGGNVTVSRHFFNVVGPAINGDLWKSFSGEDRDTIQKISDEVTGIQREKSIAQESSYIQIMKDRGSNVVQFKNPKELLDLFTPYWKQYAAEKNVVDVFEKILRVSAKYSK